MSVSNDSHVMSCDSHVTMCDDELACDLLHTPHLQGHVANEVETEQIVHNAMTTAHDSGEFTSYLQHRGSVPTFWSQVSGSRAGSRLCTTLLPKASCYTVYHPAPPFKTFLCPA